MNLLVSFHFANTNAWLVVRMLGQHFVEKRNSKAGILGHLRTDIVKHHKLKAKMSTR